MVRIWNFTLAPGESTAMHRHDYDYHFVVLGEAQHAIYGPDGEYIIDFWSSGVIGFKINGEFLEPTVDFITIPRTHVAKNIGNTTYYGILTESKTSTQGQCSGSESDNDGPASSSAYAASGSSGFTQTLLAILGSLGFVMLL